MQTKIRNLIYKSIYEYYAKRLLILWKQVYFTF